ncbi:hypothetical protein A4G19_08585 [Pasteurellaceae bacterium Macca]|nr:hypothetical protein [Pasteurellaceae bacterium Macca]
MNTDILRRLDNLLRLGRIAEIDPSKACVRVEIGKILTDWLPVLALRAGTSRSWSFPTVGEQCLVMAIGGISEHSVVLTGLYTQTHPAPSDDPDEHLFVFADGAEIRYNQASHALNVKGIATATIQASESITADTPTLHCTGNVNIDGSLSVKGEISAQGAVSSSTQVSSKGINLTSHTHSGVEPGNKRTGTPA